MAFDGHDTRQIPALNGIHKSKCNTNLMKCGELDNRIIMRPQISKNLQNANIL